MQRLNVFATEKEIEQIKEIARMPCIAITNPAAPGPNVSPVIPLNSSPQEAAHRVALAHGLPEFEGFYGIDLRNGEFLKA